MKKKIKRSTCFSFDDLDAEMIYNYHGEDGANFLLFWTMTHDKGMTLFYSHTGFDSWCNNVIAYFIYCSTAFDFIVWTYPTRSWYLWKMVNYSLLRLLCKGVRIIYEKKVSKIRNQDILCIKVCLSEADFKLWTKTL